MVDAGGVLTDQYLYSPFGVEEPLTGSGNPFRYTGRYYDGEAGLYYYRSRYYDPGVGRFGQPDSILYDGGLNLYSYVGGDPINNVDPLGECAICIAAGAGAVVGVTFELLGALQPGKQLSVGSVIGAAAGGAAAGVTVLGTRSTVAAGAAAGAVDSVVRQGIDNTIASGGNVLAGIGDINLAEVGVETTIGAIAGAVPAEKLLGKFTQGITSGRGSFQNVARTQMTMKIVEPTRKLSLTTIGKIATVGAVSDAVPGAASLASGDFIRKVGDNFPNATPENIASCSLVASGCNDN
ncbi:MAG: RHS repeat-associated core domain-containing protein [Robiginitomaculum sp.]|nr:RHS repeat-associated core domain-containing protein [Robiginitomaculum sp.]